MIDTDAGISTASIGGTAFVLGHGYCASSSLCDDSARMIRIYADWNAMDEHGRLDLGIVGAQKDLETHQGDLKDGLKVLLNVQDEFEVTATLVFDKRWWAIPDEARLR